VVELVRAFAARLASLAPEREEGQALVEYALILGLIVVGATVTLEALGASTSSLLSQVQASIP
jgi:Flp pilus assembly pilin Flp